MGREPPLAPEPSAERWSILADLFAGGVAGLCCDALLHPIDTIKSRLHVQKGPPFKYRSMFHAFSHILRHEGPPGLYAGFAAVLAGSAPSHACMFAAYKFCKRRIEPHVPSDKDRNDDDDDDNNDNNNAVPPLSSDSLLTAADLASGAFGELFALPFYVPADVIAKRMQVATLGPARNYNSVAHAAHAIYHTEGRSGLYAGFWATTLRDVPFTAIQFSLFTFSKDRYGAFVHRPAVNDLEATALGVFVGAVSAVLTNPFDVIKTRFMTQGIGSQRKYHTIFQCFRTMIAEEGFLSLTRGVLPRVLWVAPGSGITLAVYERTSKFLKSTWQLEQQQQPLHDVS